MKTKLRERWQEIRLEEIAKVDSGQGAPQGENWFNGDNVFVRAGDLNKLSDGIFVGDYCEKIADDAIEKYSLKLYPKNSVVFPKSGMSITTENIAILKYDSYVVNHLAIIETENLIDSKYIFYFLKKLKILNLVQNSSYPSIRISDIKNLKILWPQKEIRGEIVSILEKAQKLKELRDKADNLTKDFLSAVFVEMFGDPIKNPRKWSIACPEDIAADVKNAITIGPFGSDLMVKDYRGSGVPLVFVKNIRENRFSGIDIKFIEPSKAQELSYCKVMPGDILMTKMGDPPGDVAIYPEGSLPGIITADCIKLTLDPKKALNLFVLWLFRTKFVQDQILRQTRGAAQQKINLTIFKSIRFPLPDLSAQNQFVEIVKTVEQTKFQQIKSRNEIENLYDSLLQKAFRGELC